MQSRQIANVLNVSDGGLAETDNNLSSSSSSSLERVQLDSGSALQQFLDHIPISSIAGIKNSLVLELKAGDTIRDAIRMLYEKDTFGAVIVDVLDTDTASIRFSDRHIGFIAFANMVLWCLEEYEKIRENAMDNHIKDIENDCLFSILDRIPQIGQTKRRNDKVWKNEEQDVAVSVALSRQSLFDWLAARIRSNSAQPLQQANAAASWMKPRAGTVKCNIDAAVFSDQNRIGLVMYIHNHLGELLFAQTVIKEGRMSSAEAEALGLWEALRWVGNLGYDHVNFETDCKFVVDNVLGDSNYQTEVEVIIDNCKEMLRSYLNYMVGELSKSFLWEPFFPVRLDDTVLHALLLLSKHRLQVLPVIQQQPDAGPIGFVTQNALVQQLLQSSELEWFDSIADKNLSDFRFEGQEHPSCVFEDQTVADALKLLWQNQTCAVAVVDRQTKKLLGNVRNSDVYNLVNNDDLLRNRTILTVEEFICTEIDNKIDTEPTIDHDDGAFHTAGSLHLKNSFTTRMDSPVTNKENDTLKQVMEHMTQTNSSFSFLINDKGQVTGLLTLRDIFLQFAPPCVNSSIDGGGFFEFALEQSGCQVKNGTMIRKH